MDYVLAFPGLDLVGRRVRTVRADSEGAFVFEIADTGPGIAPENQERLFQPFEQVDSSIRRSHGGSGLGLST